MIRNMRQSDAQVITDEEIVQGWHASVEKYEMRLRDQSERKAVSLVAEYQGNVAALYIHSLGTAISGMKPHSETDRVRVR